MGHCRVNVTSIRVKTPRASVIGLTHFRVLALSSAQRSSVHLEYRFPPESETLPPTITVPPFTVPFIERVYVAPPPSTVLVPVTESPACDRVHVMSEVGLTDDPLHVPVTFTGVAMLIPAGPEEPW